METKQKKNAQRGYTFVLHLNTVAFIKKCGQWTWKTTNKLFVIQFSIINFVVVVVVLALQGFE